MINIKPLSDKIEGLFQHEAYHIRRGFNLADISSIMCSNHLLEETVELQAEVCMYDNHQSNREQIVDEASDVLATYIHLLHLHDVSIDQVIQRCISKLDANFTFNANEVQTDTPGFSRRHRND